MFEQITLRRKKTVRVKGRTVRKGKEEKFEIFADIQPFRGEELQASGRGQRDPMGMQMFTDFSCQIGDRLDYREFGEFEVESIDPWVSEDNQFKVKIVRRAPNTRR